MATGQKKDNSTYRQKVLLRQLAVKKLADAGDVPVVLETHGGYGKLFAACYAQVCQGVVFEKDSDRAAVLGRQRPTWAVYEADCETAMAGGAGAHLTVNLLDADPYADPWPALGAFFGSERPRVDVLTVVVHDGQRQAVKRMMHKQSGRAWQQMIEWYGADLFRCYLEACRRMMGEMVEAVGYQVDKFAGFYSGHAQCNAHYLAILRQV